MTLTIDLTRQIRSAASQLALVEAIVDAPATEQETDWVEWKSRADLGVKDWQAQIARHVLGFANREPGAAARQVGGCAYIVLGAEPKNLVGTPLYDISKVEAWISAYTGVADGPVWGGTYLKVRGSDVLLVTVEAPKQGDPIWTLAKQHSPSGSEGRRPPPPWLEGAIYVRRQGRTEHANQADIRMLTARANGGTGELVLSLDADPKSAAAHLDVSMEAIQAWVAEERSRLMASVKPTKPAATYPFPASAIVGDPRSPQKFTAEVDTYLAAASRAIPSAARRGAIRRSLGMVHLAVSNPTPVNYSGVLVELEVDDPTALAYFHDRRLDHMPTPPKLHGTAHPFLYGGTLDVSAIPRTHPTYRGKIRNGQTCRIELGPEDLRPAGTTWLEPFYLLLDSTPTTSLTLRWTASATNVNGRTSAADLPLPVMSRSFSLDELLPWELPGVDE